MDIKAYVCDLLDGLYSDKVIDEVSKAVSHYAKEMIENPNYSDVPESLHPFTDARKMSQTDLEVGGNFDSAILKDLGILKGGKLKGPVNHMLARMLTIPRMIEGYIENIPIGEEKSEYTDPRLLQYGASVLMRVYKEHFAHAAEALRNEDFLLGKLKLLGELGENVCDNVENAYPANNSTEAYELFGIFHLFPGNKEVNLTSTSPGVILPTEADPLKYKNALNAIKKNPNLLRPTYFEMLSKSIDQKIGDGRARRYFASREGTKKNLLLYHELIDASKEILQGYLDLGKGVFDISLGQPMDEMKHATLVGEKGVVYSVRDPEDKKIMHNLTVINDADAKRWLERFNEQWKTGEPIDDISAIDRLISE